VIVDGAFTKLYLQWDAAGSDRFVRNCACYLAADLTTLDPEAAPAPAPVDLTQPAGAGSGATAAPVPVRCEAGWGGHAVVWGQSILEDAAQSIHRTFANYSLGRPLIPRSHPRNPHSAV
jgi:hypothetical protein